MEMIKKNLVWNMLFERGAVEFGAFKLKHHEKNPNDPLSPFFFNVRTRNNPKPGPLTARDCELVAGAIWNEVLKSRIIFTDICPIPNAGNPIVEALLRIVPEPRDFGVVPLGKAVTDFGRKIIPKEGFRYKPGSRILLIDDLITKADTKFEAIRCLEEAGCKIAALAVLIDREGGGVRELRGKGYKVIAATKASGLFQAYYNQGKIDQVKLVECLRYMGKN